MEASFSKRMICKVFGHKLFSFGVCHRQKPERIRIGICPRCYADAYADMRDTEAPYYIIEWNEAVEDNEKWRKRLKRIL